MKAETELDLNCFVLNSRLGSAAFFVNTLQKRINIQ